MAGAWNVSAAQNTRLLIEFPLGKAHVECCKILISEKFQILSYKMNGTEPGCFPIRSHPADIGI